MCGIVGYLGNGNAKEIVLDGLERLEYRGYDSAGVGLFDSERKTYRIFKEKGRIDDLKRVINTESAAAGIGHTRWATHGKVTKENAHPHTSRNGRFIVVHNGVVDNFRALRSEYLDAFRLESETDTEIIANLFEVFAAALPVQDAIREGLKRLEGSYALLIMDREDSGTVYAAKHKSPLLIGSAHSGVVAGSDLMALADHADAYLALEDGTFAELRPDGFSLYDLNGGALDYTLREMDAEVVESDKGAYPHYMLKEIHEQPIILRRILDAYTDEEERPDFPNSVLETIRKSGRIHILAAGTSMHAGLVAKPLFETLTEKPAEVHVASEFAHHTPLIDSDSLFILISQSGETADLRACLNRLKDEGYPTLTVTNVRTSTLAREADAFVEIHAGPEIAVASTKAYSAQIAVLSLLAHAAGASGMPMKREISNIAQSIEKFLEQADAVHDHVKSMLEGKSHAFYIGRGVDHAVALEASLKLKEISYIHTEGLAAGELKHGTLALIEEGTPVFALISQPSTALHTQSSISEIESRGGRVLTIGTEDVAEEAHIALRKTHPLLAPLVLVVPAQLIAYYAALELGNDIDKPRNLAKSVTVE